MFAAAAGMFGVFLFLTYYLQATKHYSAVQTGVAFLPMVGALVVVSAVVTTRLATIGQPEDPGPGRHAVRRGRHVGADRSAPSGSSYVGIVLPATLLVGVGLGSVFATGFSLSRRSGSTPMTPVSPRPRSTPCSRSVVRSAPRC